MTIQDICIEKNLTIKDALSKLDKNEKKILFNSRYGCADHRTQHNDLQAVTGSEV